MLRKLLLLFFVSFSMFAAAGADAAPAAAAQHKFVYRVQHSTYGTLGTYTNTIEKMGDMTSVTTEAHLGVSILGISLYRQDIARVETWLGNRLVGFRGVTTVNGNAYEWSGMAEGDYFALDGPEGSYRAPGDVRVANPWSREAVEGETMLTPDRGRLEMVTIREMEEATLRVNGRTVRTEHFQVIRNSTNRYYEIWLDEKGTPVQFALVTPNNTITFTLMA